LTVVTGPPGTGKSYTIMALIADHLLAGRRVLFASKMDKAVDVVSLGLEKILGSFAVARSGSRKHQRELAEKLEQLTGPNSPIRPVNKETIDQAKQEYEQLQLEIDRLSKDFERVVTQEKHWASLKAQIDQI